MLDAPLVELLLAPAHPAAALLAVQREQLPAQFPEMLAGVVDVDDLDGVGEVAVAQIPNPCCAVTEHDLTVGAVQAALPGLVVEALPERLGVLDRACVGGRSRVPDRPALGVQSGLREDAAQLDLAGPRRRAGLALAPGGGRGRDRDAGAVQLDVERGNRLARLGREPSQGRLAAIRLSPRRQVAADRVGLPLDRLATDRAARQFLQQRATARERRFAADHGEQAAHARRVLRALDVEVAVERGRTPPAVPAVLVGPSQAHHAEQADQLLGPRPLAAQGAAAGAQRRLARVLGFLQQLFQQPRPGPVQGRASRLFESFEVERAELAPGVANHSQQAPDLGLDGGLDRA